MKEKVFNITIALCLITLAIIIMGDVVKIWEAKNFFRGWWTILIMVPSLMGIIFKSSKLSYTYLLCIALVLLLACQRVITFNQFFILMIAILLFLLAFQIIRMVFFKNKKKELLNNQALLYTGIFGSIEEKFNSINFDGCKILTVCGSVDLDLSNTKIKKDSEISITCSLGSVNLIIPKNVEIKLNGKSIMGEIENSKSKTSKPIATMYINAKCVLGSIEIR